MVRRIDHAKHDAVGVPVWRSEREDVARVFVAAALEEFAAEVGEAVRNRNPRQGICRQAIDSFDRGKTRVWRRDWAVRRSVVIATGSLRILAEVSRQ